ncbi:MAG TPA: division/cell wall cluster transcriptional repressor MraZ, partial [Verrucomicrobiae bacterium]|nr:division/cell wall cluster transcriptional repressor MraZ [Verrucomicrobiae bacterium]
MFIGRYHHTIDSKGRIIVPAKIREGLGDNFVVTKGLDGSLTVYPQTEWQAFVDKLNALPSTNPDARAYQRFVFSGASECEVDKQGRIL